MSETVCGDLLITNPCQWQTPVGSITVWWGSGEDVPNVTLNASRDVISWRDADMEFGLATRCTPQGGRVFVETPRITKAKKSYQLVFHIFETGKVQGVLRAGGDNHQFDGFPGTDEFHVRRAPKETKPPPGVTEEYIRQVMGKQAKLNAEAYAALSLACQYRTAAKYGEAMKTQLSRAGIERGREADKLLASFYEAIHSRLLGNFIATIAETIATLGIAAIAKVKAIADASRLGKALMVLFQVTDKGSNVISVAGTVVDVATVRKLVEQKIRELKEEEREVLGLYLSGMNAASLVQEIVTQVQYAADKENLFKKIDDAVPSKNLYQRIAQGDDFTSVVLAGYEGTKREAESKACSKLATTFDRGSSGLESRASREEANARSHDDDW